MKKLNEQHTQILYNAAKILIELKNKPMIVNRNDIFSFFNFDDIENTIIEIEKNRTIKKQKQHLFSISTETIHILLKIALTNKYKSYNDIVDEIRRLGYAISKNTVRNYLIAYNNNAELKYLSKDMIQSYKHNYGDYKRLDQFKTTDYKQRLKMLQPELIKDMLTCIINNKYTNSRQHRDAVYTYLRKKGYKIQTSTIYLYYRDFFNKTERGNMTKQIIDEFHEYANTIQNQNSDAFDVLISPKKELRGDGILEIEHDIYGKREKESYATKTNTHS